MCQALRELIEDGRQEGIQQGITVLIQTCQSFGASWEETLQRLKEAFGLSDETAVSNLREHWR